MSEYTDEDVARVAEALHLNDYGRWTSGPDPLGTPWGTSREQRHRPMYEEGARMVLDASAAAIAARAKAEYAEELADRLSRARDTLTGRARDSEGFEHFRLDGKANGVALALSYVEEAIRANRNGRI